jgi:DNA helicase-2/ATP-dependent DNA helicase PcrA
MKFYDRREVKDLLAYLKFLHNPQDSLALSRIINVPRRGIGEKTIGQLAEYAIGRGQPLRQALADIENIPEVGRGTQEKIKQFFTQLQAWEEMAKAASPMNLLQNIIEITNYIALLEQEGTEESLDRKSNLEELVNAVAEYCQRDPEASLARYLEEVSLVSDTDSLADPRQFVHLMTLHSAKGLEFDTVFVTGLEEGLFPLVRSDQEESNREEERRLLYVGLTRGRKRVFITYCRFRHRYGSAVASLPSSFLNELPETGVEFRRETAAEEPLRRQREYVAEPTGAVKERPVPTPDFGEQPMPDYENQSQVPVLESWKRGQVVVHPLWGTGEITFCSGFGADMMLTITFGEGSKKKVMAKYAKLRLAN